MARQKPKIVDTVRSEKSGLTCDIYLDKRTMIFSAGIDGISYENRDGDELRKQVLAGLDSSASYEWLRVIKLAISQRSMPYGEHNGVVIMSANRLYIARRGDGQWVYSRWETPSQDRLRFSWKMMVPKDVQGLPFYSRSYSDCQYYMAYSDLAWEQVKMLLQHIAAIETMFDNLAEQKVDAMDMVSGLDKIMRYWETDSETIR